VHFFLAKNSAIASLNLKAIGSRRLRFLLPSFAADENSSAETRMGEERHLHLVRRPSPSSFARPRSSRLASLDIPFAAPGLSAMSDPVSLSRAFVRGRCHSSPRVG